MSDALDDWEQADEFEIQAPVAATPVPVKKKMAILSRPSTGSPGPTAGAQGGSPGSLGVPGRGIGRGGGSPMILKRNPGSNSSSGGSTNQQEPLPSGQGSPTPPFGRETSPFGDSGYNNSGRRPAMGAGYREEDPDLIRILRRPKSPVQAVRVSNQVKSKPLAQREADYNAAREKIFGPSPTATPTSLSPSPNSPNNNNNNDITPGSRTHSGGPGIPRRIIVLAKFETNFATLFKTGVTLSAASDDADLYRKQ
ncbi:hypothetical protein BGZ47_009389 [Haplosporangium gracile]|nr:hypothetical protein BGZ47_009389 [Haplosporangium gracile]